MYVTELLEACGELEGRVAQIYRAFARRFEDDRPAARLWRELALEEETHADILKRERRSFDEHDEVGPFLPTYDERVEAVRRRLAGLEHRASLCPLEDAFGVASELEQCGLTEIYEDLVVFGDPAFKLLSERLEATLSSLPPHHERVQRAVAEHRRTVRGQRR